MRPEQILQNDDDQQRKPVFGFRFFLSEASSYLASSFNTSQSLTDSRFSFTINRLLSSCSYFLCPQSLHTNLFSFSPRYTPVYGSMMLNSTNWQSHGGPPIWLSDRIIHPTDIVADSLGPFILSSICRHLIWLFPILLTFECTHNVRSFGDLPFFLSLLVQQRCRQEGAFQNRCKSHKN